MLCRKNFLHDSLFFFYIILIAFYCSVRHIFVNYEIIMNSKNSITYNTTFCCEKNHNNSLLVNVCKYIFETNFNKYWLYDNVLDSFRITLYIIYISQEKTRKVRITRRSVSVVGFLQWSVWVLRGSNRTRNNPPKR